MQNSKINMMAKKNLYICLLSILTLNLNYGQNTNYKDCNNAYPVCEKKTYHFENTKGIGKVNDHIPVLRAKADDFKETNSFWLKWRIKKSGDLSFIITPHDIKSDIDFVVFRQTGSDCTKLQEIRSMVSGENLEEDLVTYINCIGITGLTPHSIKEFDNAGCGVSSDNFLKSLETQVGDEFIMLVNNFESGSGFSISFEGQSELEPYDICSQQKSDFEIINLFPNPGKDFVNVEFSSNSDTPIQYTILSNKGEILGSGHVQLEKDKDQFTLQTVNLTSGAYIIQLNQDTFFASRIFIKI